MTDPMRDARFAIPKWFSAAVLALLATIVVLLIVLITRGGTSSAPKPPLSLSSTAEVGDYPGGGTDRTATVVVACGMDGRQIGQALVSAGVVKSVQAYLDAANTNQASSGIVAGKYVLHTHMSAQLALVEILNQKPERLSAGCGSS